MAAAIPVRKRVLPGFGLTVGLTVTYLGLIVLIPLSVLFAKTASLSWSEMWSAISAPRAVAAYRLSFGAALTAAAVNVSFGLLVAWVLTRYDFPGKRVVDAMVDLPFALPTAVAGITLTALYSEYGWIGRLLALAGVKVAFTPLGIVVALVFVGLPFVIRAVQPVLEDLEREAEEAASSLGASRWQTFRRVLLPAVRPALLTGGTLAFARGVGEYGSVVFISGNMPLRTEIAPLLIVIKLEQYNYAEAAAIGAVMLVLSFALLLSTNLLQFISRRSTSPGEGGR
ncbi:MAG TPA: sulfate ABC transporter permease subunit CysT [bacterium]